MKMSRFVFSLFALGLFAATFGKSVKFCFSKDNVSELDTFLDLVDGLVAERCAKEDVKTRRTEVMPMDCSDYNPKHNKSGIYPVWPRSRLFNDSVKVLCDMDDDGGGWTVIQRRGDFGSGEEYFFRDWNSYKDGFGDMNKDFWIGNDVIFALTNQRAVKAKFVLGDWEGVTAYATYDEFWIDDEYNNYTLHVAGYNGTAGDSFSQHDECPFSTKDRENSRYGNTCSLSHRGAWWYKKCFHSHLNGPYCKGEGNSTAVVNWIEFRGSYYSLKDTYIKIRPNNYGLQTV